MTKRAESSHQMTSTHQARVNQGGRIVSDVNRPPALAKPIAVRSSEDGVRFHIVCSDSESGVITTTHKYTEPRLRKGMMFRVTEPELGTIELHLQLAAPDTRLTYGDRRAFRFTWLAITARERRSNLVHALHVLCGLNARISAADDALGAHRTLVFDAVRKQVRLINVGESVLQPVGAPVVSATPSIRGDGDPGRVLTQPNVLIDTEVMNRARPEAEEPISAASAPHERRHFAIRESYVPKETRQAHDGPRPLPVYFCAKETGVIEQSGRKFRVTFGWVGHTHCAFSVEPGIDIQIGGPIRVGVPGSRIGSDTIWVAGRASRTAVHHGRHLVEVDLRHGDTRLNPSYGRLVEFYFHRSKDAAR